MLSTEDWSVNPLNFVAKAFQESKKGTSDWPQNAEKFFAEKISDGESWKSIVSINETPNYMLIDGQVAKFRGMIQVHKISSELWIMVQF